MAVGNLNKVVVNSASIGDFRVTGWLSQMTASSSYDIERVFDAYLSAIKGAFGTEPWDDIAQYAEAAWREIRGKNSPEWDAIKDRVRAEWP